MSKRVPLFITLVCMVCGCDKLDKMIPEAMSPLITVAEYAVNSSKPACGDTLYVGDTLQISVALDPFYNTIQHFDVQIDERYMSDSIFFIEDYLSYCDTVLSRPDSGKYYFKDMVPSLGVFVPRMQFIAHKSPDPDSTYVAVGISMTTDVDTSKTSNVCTKTFKVRILNRPVPDSEDESIDEKVDRLIREARKAGKS